MSSQHIDSNSQCSLLTINSKPRQEDSNIKGLSLIKKETNDSMTAGRCFYPFKHAIELERTRRKVYTCDLCGALIIHQETWFCNRCNSDICNSCYSKLR
jgi:ribosomal protein L37AE/L43A